MKTLLLCLILIFIVSSCSFRNVDAGKVIVYIDKPVIIGKGGVRLGEVGTTGFHLYWLTTDVIEFDIRPNQIKERFNDLMTSDNVPVDFDAYFQYQLISKKTPALLNDFSEQWYDRKIKQVFREYVRDFAKDQPVFKLTTDKKTVDKMTAQVKTRLIEYISQQNMPIKIMRIVIGKVNPPQEVIAQTVATAAQKQRRKTETERGITEDYRKVAEQKKALADRAYREKFGMTVAQYLEMRRLEIEETKVTLAKEKKDVDMVFITGGGATPIVNLKGTN